jgi:hypothetical protein
MFIDTTEFEAIRGEVRGLGARVDQLAAQQLADREELARTRWLVGDGLGRVEEALAGLAPKDRPAATATRLRVVR